MKPTPRQLISIRIPYTCECQDLDCLRQVVMTQAERRAALQQEGHNEECLSIHHPDCKSGASRTYRKVHRTDTYVVRCEREDHYFLTGSAA